MRRRRSDNKGRNKQATATNNNIIYNFDKQNVVEYTFVFNKNLKIMRVGGERIVKEKYRKKKKGEQVTPSLYHLSSLM